jgi:hypothetical protein
MAAALFKRMQVVPAVGVAVGEKFLPDLSLLSSLIKMVSGSNP